MKKLFLLTVVGALMLSASPCSAGIPHLINYQGMLTDNAGIPINEPRDLTFTIYNVPANGVAFWTETLTAVTIENGLFNVILGYITPIPDSVFNEPERYLGIKVGTDPELVPRIQLTSVGYAYRTEMAGYAMFADSAGVATPGSGSHWSVNDSVLYTNDYWGIARGDAGNVLYGDSAHTMVNFGVACTTGTIGQNYLYSTVSGGYGNLATGHSSTVGGGNGNRARGGQSVVCGGGSCGADSNSAQGAWSIIGAGYGNIASGHVSVVMGGLLNIASGPYSTISGGTNHEASGPSSTVCGGEGNKARGHWSVVSGGGGPYVADSNAAIGDCSVVPGGRGNIAGGNFSLAAGRRAKALHHGCFVWADSTDADFTSTDANQFLIRASGGVGIGTNNPSRILHIKGDNPRILIEAQTSNPEVNFISTGDPFSEVWALYKDTVSNDFRFYQNGDKMTIENSTGNVGIGTTDPSEKIDVNGTARLRGITTGGGTANVFADGNGKLWKQTSSLRYKKNIRELSIDPQKFLQLEPVRFEWKTTGGEDIGLIAEDVENVVPDLVIYDNEGRPDGVKYDKIAIYLLGVVKNLKSENEELKKRIEALESRE